MSSLKLFDEGDYFMCEGGLKPAPLKKNQEVVQREDGNYYLTEYSLQCKGIDFSCRWIALLIAIVAAAIALLCSCPAGWVLLAAIAGAAGGSILAGKICGDKAAIMRVWLVIKEDAFFTEHRAVVDRIAPHLECKAFGKPILYKPNITNEFDAILIFGGNIIETGLEGFMWVYAFRGGGTLLTKPLTFCRNFGVNYIKSLSGKGLLMRGVFGMWGGVKDYYMSDTKGFDAKRSGIAALQSFGFAEMALYNAVTKRDIHSIALLLSMGGIPAGKKTGQKNALGMEKIADATKTDFNNSVAKVKNGVKSAIDTAKGFREKLKSQEKGNSAYEGIKKGKVTITQEALDFASKNKNEMAKLEQLKQTAENLAEQGFDVEIRGEGVPNGQGELTISRSDIGKSIPAENKNLSSNKPNKAQANISTATVQAGDGGTVIIDGKQSGMTVESFEEGLESFKRTSVPNRVQNGKSGTYGKIIFIDAEGNVHIYEYP